MSQKNKTYDPRPWISFQHEALCEACGQPSDKVAVIRHWQSFHKMLLCPSCLAAAARTVTPHQAEKPNDYPKSRVVKYIESVIGCK